MFQLQLKVKIVKYALWIFSFLSRLEFSLLILINNTGK